MMIRLLKFILLSAVIGACNVQSAEKLEEGWQISVIPASIRIDPTTNEIIDNRFDAVAIDLPQADKLLEKNWVYDGEQVEIHAARGEYISFQLVISNYTEKMLTGIQVDMSPFENEDRKLNVDPELFLEWSVKVETPSTGYTQASLGEGWYPDALIPFQSIQIDSSKVSRRWTYPLVLPDFNNRISDQKSQVIWVDQYIPFEKKEGLPGTYSSVLSVTIDNVSQEIPISLTVWDFAIPNENKLKASLQHEGFLSGMEEEKALEVYQLFKRNRVSLMDPTYQPDLEVMKDGEVKINWNEFDQRLYKYLSGEAFTAEYGYEYGPGYGEPIETFALPFDVYGKHGTVGWPDIGMPDEERNPNNQAIYIASIRKVRNHLQTIIDTDKTDLTVYLNGLDESYFPEAWERMVYFGDIFKKEYPEAQFRVDGAYTQEAMNIIGESIDAWASHTINYNIDEVEKYQKMGIKDWLYGPMLYESKVNSWVGSSTFIDLPIVNDRAISWSCWKYNTYSWISWGIGAGWERGWYDPESWKDFYKEDAEADEEFTYRKFNGNGSLIYKPGVVPNVNVPCPSIRLKTMRNGVQEYEYMRLLAEIDGNTERADKIVNEIINHPFGENAIGEFEIWSYDAEKWDQARLELGKLINESHNHAN